MNLPRPSATVATSGAMDRRPGTAALDGLADALAAECALIDELTTVMQRQRIAVAADDLGGVDDSVFATHRLLLTLGEARKRRRSLNRLAGCEEETGVKQLEHALGARMTPRLREVRDALQTSARRLSSEIEVNRRVLHEAITNNEAYVRVLRGAPEHTAAYGATGSAVYAAAGPTAISRTA